MILSQGGLAVCWGHHKRYQSFVFPIQVLESKKKVLSCRPKFLELAKTLCCFTSFLKCLRRSRCTGRWHAIPGYRVSIEDLPLFAEGHHTCFLFILSELKQNKMSGARQSNEILPKPKLEFANTSSSLTYMKLWECRVGSLCWIIRRTNIYSFFLDCHFGSCRSLEWPLLKVW